MFPLGLGKIKPSLELSSGGFTFVVNIKYCFALKLQYYNNPKTAYYNTDLIQGI